MYVRLQIICCDVPSVSLPVSDSTFTSVCSVHDVLATILPRKSLTPLFNVPRHTMMTVFSSQWSWDSKLSPRFPRTMASSRQWQQTSCCSHPPVHLFHSHRCLRLKAPRHPHSLPTCSRMTLTMHPILPSWPVSPPSCRRRCRRCNYSSMLR